MIDYNSGQLTDIMPVNMQNEQTIAISYAMQKALQKLLGYTAACAGYGDLEKMPDPILNLMAVESRTQYYDLTAPRKVRETMVSKTMEWYMKGGTGSVLEEYLATVYGGGAITEWFEYGGKPYCFKAIVSVDDEISVPIEASRGIIERMKAYKNTRSWLEALALKMDWLIRWNITYKNGLCVKGGFYPRYNLDFHHLAGCHTLDGSRYLNGYAADELVDFYPLVQSVGGQVVIKKEIHEILGTIGSAHVDISQEVALQTSGKVVHTAGYKEDMVVTVETCTSPEWLCGLIIEHNLRRLDGTGFLDGSRMLDTYVLHEDL